MITHEEWSQAQTETTVPVEGDDRRVAYWEGGVDNDGPPVVFVHGIPTWSFLWRDVAPAVAEDRHVIAVDMLGYGNSDMRDDFDRSIRVQEEMLAAFLDEYDAASFVAHDIGGGAVLRYASHSPDAVDQLVLSNVVCYDSWPVEFIVNLGLPETADRDPDELEGTFEFAFADGLAGDPADHEQWVEGIPEPWRSDEGRTSLARCAVSTNTNHTTTIDYGAITAKTLLLWAEDDAMQPIEYARRLEADLAGETEMAPLSDAYHWVVEDRTDAYREAAVEFLT
jgi:pimeloyl-ACP methyl ester carboxylesterase